MSYDSYKLMVKQMDGKQLSFVFDSEIQNPDLEVSNMVNVAVASSGSCLLRQEGRLQAISSAKILQFSSPSASTAQSQTSLVDRIVNSVRLYN